MQFFVLLKPVFTRTDVAAVDLMGRYLQEVARRAVQYSNVPAGWAFEPETLAGTVFAGSL